MEQTIQYETPVKTVKLRELGVGDPFIFNGIVYCLVLRESGFLARKVRMPTCLYEFSELEEVTLCNVNVVANTKGLA